MVALHALHAGVDWLWVGAAFGSATTVVQHGAIKERYQVTGDTHRAIGEGIARTGRPITNAAIIMIIVFVAFGVTGPIPPTELGLTLAVAVLLDATVVRVMLVPATMALLGDRSWYAPAWLKRILPNITFSH